MGEDQARVLLQKGIAAARANRPDVARPALEQVIRLDPYNETAWLWLSSVARNDSERADCLRQLLAINPQNEFALKGLRALGVEPVHTTEPTRRSTVPVLDDARYARVQKPLDEFLRRYSPDPPEQLHIQWVRKTRGRYAERGTTRMRQVATVAAAIALVVLVGFGAVALSQSGLLGDDGTAVAALSTRVPTLAPFATFTPTPGGPTPTPFPEPLAVPPTRAPINLVRYSDPFGLATPTAIYPRLETNVAYQVEEAARYYAIGDYDQAIAILSGERERSSSCYPSVVYYEALSQAARGSFREASSLLDWADSYEAPRGFTSCEGSPLLIAARGQLAYLRDPRSPDAVTYSQAALEADPKLVLAIVTQARAQLAQGQRDAARALVTGALIDWPDDTNLLVLAGEIALLDGQPGVALEHVGLALAMEPALEPALHLQAQAYLDQAAQAVEPAQRLIYYGLAVRSAETVLYFYPGDAAGYLQLAKARLGEGNQDLAETALTRIIHVADVLPETDEATVEAAYRLRGDLLYRQGRVSEAADDLAAAYRISGDETLARRIYDITLENGDILGADQWLTLLLSADPRNGDYKLLEAKLYVEDCAADNSPLQCRYDTVLNGLSDTFVERLRTDDQKATAYSYRAHARYAQLARSRVVGSDARRESLTQALEDVTHALEIRKTREDVYLRGVIADALGDQQRAYEDYQWVSYWQSAFSLPAQDDLDERYAAVAMEVRRTAVPTATPTPAESPTATPQAASATPRAATAAPATAASNTTTPEDSTPVATPTAASRRATPTPTEVRVEAPDDAPIP